MATHHHCQQYQYHRRSFRRCDLRMPPSPTPLWVQVWCWVHGQMCAGFSNLQTLMSVGEYGNRVHSIFPTKLSGIRQTDQSCHHEVWFRMDFVEQHNGHARERHERRLLLEERSAPYHYSKQRYKAGEDASDHSLSSWNRRSHATNTARLRTAPCTNTALLRHVTIPVHQGQQHLT